MELTRIDYIIIGVILGLVYYMYVMPTLKENMESVEKVETVMKADMQQCSRDCCKHTQWPVPHMDNEDKDHVGTNLMCNGGSGGGCVCMKDNDFEYLSGRAENGLDRF